MFPQGGWGADLKAQDESYGDKNHQKLSEIMLVLRTLVDSVHQGFFFVARRLLNVHRVGRCARMDMSQASVADLLGSANLVSQIITWSAYRCILTFHQIHIDSHPFHHPPSPVLPCSPLFSPVLPCSPLSSRSLFSLSAMARCCFCRVIWRVNLWIIQIAWKTYCHWFSLSFEQPTCHQERAITPRLGRGSEGGRHLIQWLTVLYHFVRPGQLAHCSNSKTILSNQMHRIIKTPPCSLLGMLPFIPSPLGKTSRNQKPCFRTGPIHLGPKSNQ